MIRNLVFDMGMVLLHFDPLAGCKRYYPDEADARRVVDALVGQPWWTGSDAGLISDEDVAGLAQAYLRETGAPGLAAHVPELMARWPELCLTPVPGIERVIDAAKDAGLRVYLLSNAGPYMSRSLKMIPRIERFDGTLISADEKLLKPCPGIFRRLCEKFALRPEECLFVDDLLTNVIGARYVGFQAVRFDGDPGHLLQTLGL